MATSLRNPSRPALGATRARQGRHGRHVLWVLLVSTALASLALFGAWTWREPDLTSTGPHNARQPADARAFGTGEPAAQQTPPSSRLP